MATSQAQIEANQRNAQLSTGPKTVEGKAQTRLNAFQHGLAGGGDLLAPGENAELVAERTKMFAVEFQASGVAGAFLAHRLAVLSIRMDRAEVDDEASLLAHVQAARAAFEATRISELDRLTDLLTRDLVMHGAREQLEQMPEGINRLLLFWDRERQAIADQTASPYRRQRLGSLLGLTAEEMLAATPEQLFERIDAERARLQQVDDATSAERFEALEQARECAGRAARLDPPRQVLQIRRYDAAAERGFFRTVRVIRDLNVDQARTAKTKQAIKTEQAAKTEPVQAPTVPPPSQPTSAPVPTAPSVLRPVARLGSFRPDIPVSAAALVPAVGSGNPPQFHAESQPKKRRDVRKVKSRRR